MMSIEFLAQMHQYLLNYFEHCVHIASVTKMLLLVVDVTNMIPISIQ